MNRSHNLSFRISITYFSFSLFVVLPLHDEIKDCHYILNRCLFNINAYNSYIHEHAMIHKTWQFYF